MNAFTRLAGLAHRAPALDLIRRYDGNGPRYTSYPTALSFHSDFGPLDYVAAVDRANRESPQGPLSVYVHIPFCASPCFYCACTKIITRQQSLAEPYLQRLQHEIELNAALLSPGRRIEQLHFGGGTPTFLSNGQIAGLLSQLERRFGFAPTSSLEFSIEVDPRTVTTDSIHELRTLGFNRLSFGIQDFDPAVQRAVNREQSVHEVAALVDASTAAGFRSLSMDLIYGLPLQTRQSFERTLKQVIALRPQRLATYSYAHLPSRFKPQKRIDASQLPSAAEKLDLLQLTIESLLDAGYVHIGMDHFALPDDELALALANGTLQRNFQGYSTRADLDLIGLGMSSISRIADVYSQNARALPAYDASIDSGRLAVEKGLRLSGDDLLRREVIAAIMCSGELDFAEIGARHHIDFPNYFADAMRKMEAMREDGLVSIDHRRLRVTSSGRFLLRNIAMPFDAHLGLRATPGDGQPVPFSRVI
jgi:oxygen-independent coproporphyrinogen-3 oxidase